MPRLAKILERGLELHQAGRREEAEKIYRQVLGRDPKNADALHLLGLLAKDAGDPQAAFHLIHRAADIAPRSALLHNNLGTVLESLERLDEAIQSYGRAVAVDPGYADAELNLGNALFHQGRVDEAVAHFERAIRRRPDLAEAHNSLGAALRARGETARAAACFQQALRLKPACVEAHVNLGALWFASGNKPAAESSFRAALALRPDLVDIRGALTVVLIGQERFVEAEQLARENLGRKPGDAEALGALAISVQMQQRHAEALECYRQALVQRPDSAELHHNFATCLNQARRPVEAEASCRRALAIQPGFAAAHNTLGHAFAQMGRLEEAISSYRRALALQPRYAEASTNLAAAQLERGRLSEAIAACREAIAADSRFTPAYNNLGTASYQAGDVDAAVAAFRQVLAIRPGYASAHSNLLFCLNYGEQWPAKAVFEEHRAWAAAHAPSAPAPPRPGRPIHRIGYVSPDFREHPVARFVEPILRAHDRESFEIHLFSNTGRPDLVTQRLRALADGWHEIGGLSDDDAAALVRRREIDLLVDLAGHTAGNRLPMFARRPAPVQVTYCGYPNTTGLEAIDYRLTDAWADPPGTTEHLHTERLIRLPRGFLCYVPPVEAPGVGELPSRRAAYVTFGSFNALPKIRPATVQVWSEILRRVPRSRLILKAKGLSDPAGRGRVATLFATEGTDESRIELAPTLPSHTSHLDLYNRVDIALDTFPYHGTTTTCEALWMGVPVVVLAGATHVSRVGVSLLERIGMGELVADSPEAYIASAVTLAQDTERLAGLRACLRRRMTESPLCDAAAFTRSLEAAYRHMWEERYVRR